MSPMSVVPRLPVKGLMSAKWLTSLPPLFDAVHWNSPVWSQEPMPFSVIWRLPLYMTPAAFRLYVWDPSPQSVGATNTDWNAPLASR